MKRYVRTQYNEMLEMDGMTQWVRYDDVEAALKEKDAEIARLQKLVADLDAQLGKRPCQTNRCMRYAERGERMEAMR